MKKTFLSRQYLESMSTADLIGLADDYGIDIPDNLNRRFIIGELLETAQNDSSKTNDSGLKENAVQEQQTLPETYNDTTLGIYLRNPAWLYIYWDLNQTDLALFKSPECDSLFLRASFFDSAEDEKPSENIDVKISVNQKEQYILMPANKKAVVVDLAYKMTGEQPKVLCFTKKTDIPQEREDIKLVQPGKKIPMSPLVDLSGMSALLDLHYVNHRQSFS